MIKEKVRIISISAKITVSEEGSIKDFLSGAVFSFCKNCLNEDGEPDWFGARDLVGGVNKDWRKTPLQCIYDWHCENGASDPFDMAAKDIGHILKVVISDDKKREYITRKEFMNRQYKWVSDLEIK